MLGQAPLRSIEQVGPKCEKCLFCLPPVGAPGRLACSGEVWRCRYQPEVRTLGSVDFGFRGKLFFSIISQFFHIISQFFRIILHFFALFLTEIFKLCCVHDFLISYTCHFVVFLKETVTFWRVRICMFLLKFHFCQTSLLIFSFLNTIIQHLNIRKGQ